MRIRIGKPTAQANGDINQRARRARLPGSPEAVSQHAVPRETTAEAIALLDLQFPWLRR
jgi:hypothetical protein